jgi:hypothetical protein
VSGSDPTAGGAAAAASELGAMAGDSTNSGPCDARVPPRRRIFEQRLSLHSNRCWYSGFRARRRSWSLGGRAVARSAKEVASRDFARDLVPVHPSATVVPKDLNHGLVKRQPVSRHETNLSIVITSHRGQRLLRILLTAPGREDDADAAERRVRPYRRRLACSLPLKRSRRSVTPDGVRVVSRRALIEDSIGCPTCQP